MKNKRIITSLFIISALLFTMGAATAYGLTDKEGLGKSIFFDQSLSKNGNQSCAACHTPDAGWTGPLADINAHGAVYEGSIAPRFGNRKPPSAAYATPSPVLHFVIEKKEPLFIGGNFWDGRATGEKLGNPAADQAQGPFLNPLEQALKDSACVVYSVCNAAYPVPFEAVYPGGCAITWPASPDDPVTKCANDEMVPLTPENRAKVETAYDNIGLVVAAYEASSEVNAFTSKYDCYLAGSVDLTKEEKKGLNLFNSKGKCAGCHILEPGPDGERPLLTDFTYDNIGVPRNPENPFYTMPAEFNPLGYLWIDLGIGGFFDSRVDYQQFASEHYGKQKVPTLRNVDKRPDGLFVKAYTHNGYFKSLKETVHFYNTRDVKPVCLDPFTTAANAIAGGCWPVPEVPINVNTGELGDLKLTDAQEDSIVEFLKTFSDGYTCQ